MIFMPHSILWTSSIGLLSLLVGSFLNVVIYRMPLMMRGTTTHQRFNLAWPNSHCPSCQTAIKPWHNIPLLSYLLLKGRCHACQQCIAWHYPVVECLSMLLGVFLAWILGGQLVLVWSLLLVWCLICLTFIDFYHQLLPDTLTLGVLWLGLLINSTAVFTSLPDAVWSAAGAYLSLWLLAQIYTLITHKIGMGHGDFKLFAALSAWFGWQAIPGILLIASLSGSVIGLIYLKLSHQSKDTPIPFGPFLCIAGLMTLITTVLKQF